MLDPLDLGLVTPTEPVVLSKAEDGRLEVLPDRGDPLCELVLLGLGLGLGRRVPRPDGQSVERRSGGEDHTGDEVGRKRVGAGGRLLAGDGGKGGLERLSDGGEHLQVEKRGRMSAVSRFEAKVRSPTVD